jgi:pyruvate,water dikinase
VVGALTVSYTQALPEADEGPFLKEERKLIDTIADRVGQAVLHRELTDLFERRSEDARAPEPRAHWDVVLDLLRRTDLNLYRHIARKMLNHLSVNGVEEAKELLARQAAEREREPLEDNRPIERRSAAEGDRVAAETFEIAARNLSESDLLASVQVWIKEERVAFLLNALERQDTSLAEIASALERYQHTGVRADELSMATQVSVTVSLVRRLLTDQLDYISVCRRYARIDDFEELMSHTVLLPNSHGRLGGKSSGVFLARHVIRSASDLTEVLGSVRFPNSWYIPSDGIIQFVAHNDLGDVFNWKYQDIDQIRQEYPHLLQVFKNSRFPPEMINGLSRALDDLGDGPLIVRSSSLLEDRAGSAFSGKYKSLFLANRGTKAERLAALLDAVAEVYASVFHPDPIQYRIERGLLEHHEEMGIMIQRVVGRRVGRFFLPAYSGVAFSINELRWSPRIRREDGLLRLVPGLGTRAVDRLADDYPILIAPGQPGLRVNVTPEEIYRYSPRKIDLIDLEANRFDTIDRHAFMREVGHELPGLTRQLARFDGEAIRRVAPLELDFERDDAVFTFEGLLTDTAFVTQVRSLLAVLSEALHAPVDIEFASDGEHFHLLQCRPQSYALTAPPAAIPHDVPAERVLFSAHRHVTSGIVDNVTHIVLVDPDAFSRLDSAERLREVGRAVGRLNKLLPKRQFILIGPGRWGSRGDIRLGVSVTYADINNTAMLVEVARQRGRYVPDLSFGTHFFQDLVEAGIRYLPLYPDEAGVVFREAFFRNSENMLPSLLPQHAALADVVRVIDVPRASQGLVLRVLMNSELDEAVGILVPPGTGEPTLAVAPEAVLGVRPSEDHWRWRLRMAERLARELDPERFGIAAVYVFGSTKNATAGPGSDIDLLVHFRGDVTQRRELEAWLQGWSLSLAEINYLRTGYRSQGLLDVTLLTDEDIARRTSYAAKIGAVTDAARPLPLGEGSDSAS